MSVNVNAEQLSQLIGDPRVVSLEENFATYARDGDYKLTITDTDKLFKLGDKGKGRTVAYSRQRDRRHAPGLRQSNRRRSLLFQAREKRHLLDVLSRQNDLFHGTALGRRLRRADRSEKRGQGADVWARHTSCRYRCRRRHAGDDSPRGDNHTDSGVQPHSGRLELLADIPCVVSWDDNQIAGLDYVYGLREKYKIAAANLSLGGNKQYKVPCDDISPIAQAFEAAVLNLAAANIGVTIAAGNDANVAFGTRGVEFPACLSGALAIAASDASDNLAETSSYGDLVALVAPGAAVNTTFVNNAYGEQNGTSMAAPAVAGAIADLKAVDEELSHIVAALQCSGEPLEPVAETGEKSGPIKPRIDTLRAYDYLKKPPTEPQSWDLGSSADAGLWTVFAGKWIVENGGYALTGPAKGDSGKALFGGIWVPNCQPGVSITATITRVDGGNLDETWISGVVFDAQINQTHGVISGYSFLFTKYRGSKDDPGTVAFIYRLDGYNPATGKGGLSYVCDPVDVGISFNGPHTLTVTSANGTLVGSIDGNQVCSATDRTYPSGQVGFYATFSSIDSNQSFSVSSVSVAPSASQSVDKR